MYQPLYIANIQEYKYNRLKFGFNKTEFIGKHVGPSTGMTRAQRGLKELDQLITKLEVDMDVMQRIQSKSERQQTKSELLDEDESVVYGRVQYDDICRSLN